MSEISLGLLQRRDCELDRRWAAAQAFDLRENEPHPMRPFSALAQFCAYLLEHRILGVDKAL
jgi:hypothetical protein